ncbi:MAG: type IX secretion system sortase PorU [Gracilimonas sp.]|nr:type IX secretion system sortase PorU [Gracilimonas sp.]
MLNKLLLISGLLCLIVVEGLYAQQLKVVAETDDFTDYELVNDDLRLFPSVGLTIPVQGNTPRFQILEQSVRTIDTVITADKALISAFPSNNIPLLDVSNPGIERGKKVSPASIHITRTGPDGTQVLQKLRIRVYKQSDFVVPKSSVVSSKTPLNEGTWYKIPIKRNNIYELDAEYLESLGLNLSNVDPRHIQIWGTGGFVLPEKNDEPRPDFTQIPILIEGQSDGIFNNNDRILFYGNEPHQIQQGESSYFHSIHPYDNTNYVFLTVGTEAGERLSISNQNLLPSRTLSTFTDFIWKDEELNKSEDRLKSGRYWLGRSFEASSNGTPITILTDTLPNVLETQPLHIQAKFVSRSARTSRFDIDVSGTNMGSINVGALSCPLSCSSCYNCSEGNTGVESIFNTSQTVALPDDILEVQATYTHNESNSRGFLDWIRVWGERELVAEDNRLYFYSPFDGDSTELGQYQLSGFDNTPVVMDVTNPISPKLLTVNASGDFYNLNYYTGVNLQFIAQSDFPKPQVGEIIDNQDLKGIEFYPDYIIVTSDNFLEQAEELASYRAQNSNLNPFVVTQNQVFNEFSGGVTDPSAIRNFAKFLYDRALSNGQEPPKYLLLFGDTTFDYKGIINSGFSNHVVTYQTNESLDRVGSFGTDDFFGFLDDGEGAIGNGRTSNSHLLDIGIGRIPAQTSQEAAIAIEKIKIYENPENSGSWQNLFAFAADDDLPNAQRNRDLHVLNADESAERMNILEPGLRIKKVYEFAYPEEITGSGRQVPGATDDFIGTLNSGTLVMNYSGHGNEQTLSDETLFNVDLIPNLTNRNRLATLVTATCQFGRYDDIDAQSGAEQLFFAPNGGIVAAFTTTRVVYTGSGISSNNNFGLNIALSQRMTEKNQDGSPLRMGDIYQRTKNTRINNSLIVSSRNSKKFILVGDPATTFRIPDKQSALNSINNYVESGQDTVLNIQALEQVSLSGQVNDINGSLLSDYNGELTLTVFDAPRNVNLPNNRDWVISENCFLDNCNYRVESDVLFTGKTTVQNGQFSSTFIIPKDISNSENNGRIVFFANDDGLTAGGSYKKVKFTGINEDAEDDGSGPEMDIYLNDERFVNGNLVGSSPTLIVELDDQSGINTTGTGIGHEIIATIDTEPQQSFVLNDFYEGNLNDYRKGRIEYPLDQLPEGNYNLSVRAWDVHNNPSEQEVFFEVASSEELTIRNVYNFPNPMNDATRFTFEHNQPGNPMNVSVRIYTLSGKPVQHIEQQLITTSSYASISWDGRDRDYDRLGNGTYIYVLRVTTDTQKGRQTTEKIEKLVIIR